MSIRELTDAECRRVAFGNEEVIEEVVVVGTRRERPSGIDQYAMSLMRRQAEMQFQQMLAADMQASIAQLPEHLG